MLTRGAAWAIPISLVFACQPARHADTLCSDSLQKQAQKLMTAGRAVVVKSVADLCARPPCTGALTDQALLGDVVKVLPGPLPNCLHDADAYLQIETASSYRGFVQISSLLPLPPTEPTYRQGATLVRVTSRLASIYAQATVTSGKPVLLVPVDVSLRVVSAIDDRWLKVELPDGYHGFVQRGDVAEVAKDVAPPSPACVLDHARLYAGTPYLWGGRSTLGIDCSGLVSNAFIACGVVPPRDAGPQSRWDQSTALPLAVDKLLPADLLFFGEPRDALPPKVTHVGIYIGDGRFIHATTHEHPVVHESSITDPHWTAAWVGARRYLFR